MVHTAAAYSSQHAATALHSLLSELVLSARAIILKAENMAVKIVSDVPGQTLKDYFFSTFHDR